MVSINKNKGNRVYFEILNKTQQQMSQIEKAMAGEYRDADFMLEITESDSPFSPMDIEDFVKNTSDGNGEIQTRAQTDNLDHQLTDNESKSHSLDQVFNSVLMKRLSSIRNK